MSFLLLFVLSVIDDVIIVVVGVVDVNVCVVMYVVVVFVFIYAINICGISVNTDAEYTIT